MGYDKGDYLLIRNDEILAVSGNADFDDVEEVAVEVKTGDNVVKVISTYGDGGWLDSFTD